eukprot:8268413-Alexandrium_andersonii.AAC.1
MELKFRVRSGGAEIGFWRTGEWGPLALILAAPTTVGSRGYRGDRRPHRQGDRLHRPVGELQAEGRVARGGLEGDPRCRSPRGRAGVPAESPSVPNVARNQLLRVGP